ncbi:AMP-binding protein [Fundidesulfovibrio butyratiphilus]
MARAADRDGQRPQCRPLAHRLVSFRPLPPDPVPPLPHRFAGLDLVQALRVARVETPDRCAMLVLDESGRTRSLSRAGFFDLALRVGAWCRQNGLEPGSAVPLLMDNGPRWAAAYFGVLAAGGVITPVDTASTPADVSHFLRVTRAEMALTDQPDIFLRAGFTGKLPSPEQVFSSEPLPENSVFRAGPDDTACLIFTSGTTGDPKAVRLTHANLLANVESVSRLDLLRASDTFLAVLPLHHAYPCMVNLLVPLLLGARTAFLAALKPEAVLSALKIARVSILVLTPQYAEVFHRRILARLEALPLGLGRALVRLLRVSARWRPDPLALLRRAVRRGVGPAFRFFVTGGAKADLDMLKDMAALGLPVQEGYGLSEMAPVACVNLPGEPPGAVGRPLPGVRAAIFAPDGQIKDQGEGEILLAGPNRTPGYFEDPEGTARAIRDGWLHTGDLGRLDPDGRLTIQGRSRDVVVLPSGKKLSAEEVETQYQKAPSVGEIAVALGPDGTLCALVVPDLEHFKTLDAPDIRANVLWDMDYLSRELPAYRRVRRVYLTTRELPRTRLGKLKRHLVEARLREVLGERQDDGSGPSPGPDFPWLGLDRNQTQALSLLARQCDREFVAPSEHLELDLGLDSLSRLELLSLVEEATGLSLPEESFLRLATARDLADLVGRFTRSGQTCDAEPPGGILPAASPDWTRRLTDPLTPALAAKVRLAPTRFDRVLTRGGGSLLDLAARLGFQLRVEGLENVPDGPALLCPNHASYLDGLVLFCALPARLRERLYFLGLARFFDAWPLASLALRLRLIAVDAGRLFETMRLTAYVLEHGKLACVFPEGARSVTGTLGEFRPGAGILARTLGVPVVPVAVVGTYRAWPPGGRLRPAPVRVRFGRPLGPEILAREGMGAVRRAVAEMLEEGREGGEEEEEKRKKPPAAGGNDSRRSPSCFSCVGRR